MQPSSMAFNQASVDRLEPVTARAVRVSLWACPLSFVPRPCNTMCCSHVMRRSRDGAPGCNLKEAPVGVVAALRATPKPPKGPTRGNRATRTSHPVLAPKPSTRGGGAVRSLPTVWVPALASPLPTRCPAFSRRGVDNHRCTLWRSRRNCVPRASIALPLAHKANARTPPTAHAEAKSTSPHFTSSSRK